MRFAPSTLRLRTTRRTAAAPIEVLEQRQLLSLTNGGFEAPTAAGWTVDPPFGARVTGFPQDPVGIIEGRRFAELTASTASNDLGRYSTISNTFEAQPGDVISGNAYFSSRDFANAHGTDDAYVIIKNRDTGAVATVFYAGTATGDPATSVGPGGVTPWTAFSYTFTEAGTYKIEAGVANKGDFFGPSRMGLDNVQFTGNDAAPGTGTPFVDAGGPYTVAEGDPVTVAADVFDTDDNVRTVRWDINGDGVYEVSNRVATIQYSQLAALGRGDGPDAPPLTIGVQVTDANGNVATDTATVRVVNAPPRIDRMGFLPASGPEGMHLSVTAQVADPAGTRDTVTTRWTVTRDGEPYADVTTARPEQPFEFVGDDNGTYVITLTATDEDGGSSSMSRTILLQNLAPVIRSFSGPSTGVPGQERTYSASFTDVGTADTHTTAWSVVDASGATVAEGSGTEFSFTPTEPGTYTVNFTVEDDDGGVDSASGTLLVNTVDVQPDPADPSKSVLAVGGTAGDDSISLRPGAAADSVEVFIDDVSQGTFDGVSGILVFGQAGNDDVHVHDGIVPMTFYGGDGNDKLHTKNFSDVLIGGSGDDKVVGRGPSEKEAKN